MRLQAILAAALVSFAHAYLSFSAASGNEDARRNTDAPQCRMTAADAHPDIKWLDDLSCLLEGEGRNNDTSTVEVATYMTSGQYEFVRECRAGEDVLRLFQDKGRNRPHLGSPQQVVERYSYIVIRTSPKENGHYFHQVSEKAHWARRIKACRTP